MPAPKKLFDVANGNGAVIGGETVVRGTLIWFRDNAAKNEVMDLFGRAYGYQVNVPDPDNPGQTIPNPQGIQPFFNRVLTQFIRDVVKGQKVKEAAEAAAAAAGGAIDPDLPAASVDGTPRN